jgi:hypothetical protein
MITVKPAQWSVIYGQTESGDRYLRDFANGKEAHKFADDKRRDQHNGPVVIYQVLARLGSIQIKRRR